MTIPPCACCGSSTAHRLPVSAPMAPEFVKGKVVCIECTRSGMSEREIERRIAANSGNTLS